MLIRLRPWLRRDKSVRPWLPRDKSVRPPLRRGTHVCLLAATVLLVPHAASAQWYVAGYLGTNRTLAAPIAIEQPARDTSLTFSDVTFTASPFTSPQYYGVRAGRLFGEERRFGVEVEWLHPKAYADVSKPVRISGRSNGVPVDTTAPMNTFVQHYAMSHGMNFLLFNVVVHQPLADEGAGLASRVALTARAGAGPMVPHAETTVANESREQYEAGGLGYQLAGGVDIRLVGWLSAIVDYKFGHGRPTIDIVDGTGQTTANVHQLAFGLAFGLNRAR
jgi:hypothetical protein